jgi:hypothetical protein
MLFAFAYRIRSQALETPLIVKQKAPNTIPKYTREAPSGGAPRRRPPSARRPAPHTGPASCAPARRARCVVFLSGPHSPPFPHHLTPATSLHGAPASFLRPPPTGRLAQHFDAFAVAIPATNPTRNHSLPSFWGVGLSVVIYIAAKTCTHLHTSTETLNSFSPTCRLHRKLWLVRSSPPHSKMAGHSFRAPLESFSSFLTHAHTRRLDADGGARANSPKPVNASPISFRVEKPRCKAFHQGGSPPSLSPAPSRRIGPITHPLTPHPCCSPPPAPILNSRWVVGSSGALCFCSHSDFPARFSSRRVW